MQLFLLVFASLLAAVPAAAREKGEGTIVAFGDSLTAGYHLDKAEAYPALLEKRLRELGLGYRVVNAGRNGETSGRALSRVDSVLRLHPDIVILETGANDMFRGIDPAVTRRNIEEIVRRLQTSGVVVVLAGMQYSRQWSYDADGAYTAIYPAVAGKYGLLFVPFFLRNVAGVPELNLGDRVHPNSAGYRLVVENVLPYVQQAVARVEQERSGGASGRSSPG
ncbi:MAG TPA: arylesterase [Verrucomicrobiae bacterium]|nr:arylesterase [Verrucomicrobiae bacterium]